MADTTGRADGQTSALLGRTRSVFRRTGRDLRDALAIAAELESLSSSVYVDAADEITEAVAEGVVEALRTFREENPNRELEIVFVALQEEK
jgi:hypothetical protein